MSLNLSLEAKANVVDIANRVKNIKPECGDCNLAAKYAVVLALRVHNDLLSEDTARLIFGRLHCSGLVSLTNSTPNIIEISLEDILTVSELYLGDMTPVPEDVTDVRVSTRKYCSYS